MFHVFKHVTVFCFVFFSFCGKKINKSKSSIAKKFFFAELNFELVENELPCSDQVCRFSKIDISTRPLCFQVSSVFVFVALPVLELSLESFSVSDGFLSGSSHECWHSGLLPLGCVLLSRVGGVERFPSNRRGVLLLLWTASGPFVA